MVTWAVPQRHVLTSSKTCLSLLLLKITKITNYPQIAKYTCVYLYVVSQKVEVDYSASQLASCTLLARKYNQIILLASQLPIRCQLESRSRYILLGRATFVTRSSSSSFPFPYRRKIRYQCLLLEMHQQCIANADI